LDPDEPDKAIADFNEAIRLDPENANAYRRGLVFVCSERGAVRRALGKSDEAIADYDEAIRPNLNQAWTYNSRGWVLRRRSFDLDRALADFDEAIRLDPKLTWAYINRGVVRRDRLEWARALSDLDEAVRLEPKNGEARYQRGIVRFATHRDGAADDARAVLDIQGWRANLSMYAVLIGSFAHRRAGRPDRARSLLDEAATKCDTSAWPYPIIKHLRGELDEPGLLAAAEDDGKRVEARCYLGLEAMENGQSVAAQEHFRWVKEHGNPRFTQYVLSTAELNRLLAKGAEGDGPFDR
jgi:tetratricopeptide (TPR) repeat protein